MVVSESFARHFDLTPVEILGRRTVVGSGYAFDPPEPSEIVGVVRDVRGDMRSTADTLPEAVYTPCTQRPQWFDPLEVVVRSDADAAVVVPAIRAVVARLDPSVPVQDVVRFRDIRIAKTATERLALGLLLAFGGLAAGLAALGVYGVVSYGVQLRAREIGIRLALGAPRTPLLRHLLAGGIGLAAAALAPGLGGFWVVTRFAEAHLPGLGRLDPLSLAALAIGLLVVATMATWWPAHRAVRIDPLDALRLE